MNEQITNNNIKEEILKKIDKGEINMKSKSYFIFRLVVLAFLIFMIFIFSTFLLSYVLFSIATKGNIFLLSFGAKGVYSFLMALPWFLLVVLVGLVLLLDRLLKSFAFGYKSPVLYLFIGTFVLVTILSALVNMTSFHGKLMKRGEERRLPLGNDFYGGINSYRPISGNFKGVVVYIKQNTFDMNYRAPIGSFEVIKVVASPDIEIEKFLKEGDVVFVAGNLMDGQIRAYGIKKINK